MAAVATALQVRRQEFAHLISLEMNKTINSAIAEIDLSIDIIDFYAKGARGLCAPPRFAPILRKENDLNSGVNIYVYAQPSRFSYFVLARSVARNLAVGNVIIVNYANRVPRCARIFEQLWLGAGVPVGAFTCAAHGDRQPCDQIRSRLAPSRSGDHAAPML